MPNLEALYQKYKGDRLVVLAVSDETAEKVTKFIKDKGHSFPVLLDPGRKVNQAYAIEGIPQSSIYNRTGKLASEAIHMQTNAQFFGLFAKAGLRERH